MFVAQSFWLIPVSLVLFITLTSAAVIPFGHHTQTGRSASEASIDSSYPTDAGLQCQEMALVVSGKRTEASDVSNSNSSCSSDYALQCSSRHAHGLDGMRSFIRVTRNQRSDDKEDEAPDRLNPTFVGTCIACAGVLVIIIIIVAVGIVRANKYPDRYAAREAQNGSPPQTRAQGIARALLDTVSIVRNGAQAGDKELGGQAELNATVPSSESRLETAKPFDTVCQTCSICTDIFKELEKIRILPCQHEFHKVCVDEWLVDRSATCPIW